MARLLQSSSSSSSSSMGSFLSKVSSTTHSPEKTPEESSLPIRSSLRSSLQPSRLILSSLAPVQEHEPPAATANDMGMRTKTLNPPFPESGTQPPFPQRTHSSPTRSLPKNYEPLQENVDLQPERTSTRVTFHFSDDTNGDDHFDYVKDDEFGLCISNRTSASCPLIDYYAQLPMGECDQFYQILDACCLMDDMPYVNYDTRDTSSIREYSDSEWDTPPSSILPLSDKERYAKTITKRCQTYLEMSSDLETWGPSCASGYCVIVRKDLIPCLCLLLWIGAILGGFILTIATLVTLSHPCGLEGRYSRDIPLCQTNGTCPDSCVSVYTPVCGWNNYEGSLVCTKKQWQQMSDETRKARADTGYIMLCVSFMIFCFGCGGAILIHLQIWLFNNSEQNAKTLDPYLRLLNYYGDARTQTMSEAMLRMYQYHKWIQSIQKHIDKGIIRTIQLEVISICIVVFMSLTSMMFVTSFHHAKYSMLAFVCLCGYLLLLPVYTMSIIPFKFIRLPLKVLLTK